MEILAAFCYFTFPFPFYHCDFYTLASYLLYELKNNFFKLEICKKNWILKSVSEFSDLQEVSNTIVFYFFRLKENLTTWDGLIGPFTCVEVVQKLVAEALGTAILIIVGCWTLGIEYYITADALHLSTAFGFGLAIMVVVVVRFTPE